MTWLKPRLVNVKKRFDLKLDGIGSSNDWWFSVGYKSDFVAQGVTGNPAYPRKIGGRINVAEETRLYVLTPLQDADFLWETWIAGDSLAEIKMIGQGWSAFNGSPITNINDNLIMYWRSDPASPSSYQF